MTVTHPFVSAIADTGSPAGAVGPDEWNAAHTVAIPFTDLTDVPASYTGQAGKFVKVNVSANGLSFGTASITSEGGFPDLRPSTPNAMDDEFDDSSGMSGTVNGLNARWSWVNQSTSTFTFPYESWGKLLVPSSATHNLRGIVQTLPATPCEFQMKWSFGGQNSNATCGGFWLYDHVNGDSYLLNILFNGGAYSMRLDSYASLTGAVTNVTNLAIGITNHLYTRVHIAALGGTISYYYSMDGITWVQLQTTDARGPTRVGFAVDEQNSSALSHVMVDWFRRTI